MAAFKILSQNLNDQSSTTKPTIQVSILTNDHCQDKSNETIHSSMLCAGGNGTGTNKVGYSLHLKSSLFWLAWKGDSGGPLTIIKDGVHVLAGITSFEPSMMPQNKVHLQNHTDYTVMRICKPQ